MQEENQDIRDKLEKTIRQKMGLIPADNENKESKGNEEESQADDEGK